MDESGDGVSELGFFVAECCDRNYGASGSIISRGHQLGSLQNFEVSFFGKAYQRKRSKRTAAHGVNITESVGSGDLPKV